MWVAKTMAKVSHGGGMLSRKFYYFLFSDTPDKSQHLPGTRKQKIIRRCHASFHPALAPHTAYAAEAPHV
jgi:hypothetical protein